MALYKSRHLALTMAAALVAGRVAAADLDAVKFGDAASEQRHHLAADGSDTIRGGLDQPARRLLPLSPPTWEGGHVSFTVAVDPALQNYLTIKLWGGEANANRLVLFADGKQVGYHHIGDVDLLDFGNDSGEAPVPGRFYYTTTPLPLAATRGRHEVNCAIGSIGEIWGYGQTFDKYQKDQTTATRGIYAIYTHTDGCFVPPADEPQGTAPASPPVRQAPGPEVLDALKARVGREVASELRSTKPLNEMQMSFLARAYGVRWTAAYHDPQVVSQVANGMDALYAAWRANPKLAQDDPTTPNPGWFEFGPAGQAVTLLAQPLAAQLDRPVGGTPRRVAWSQLLQAGRDYHTRHRRLYTNQSMITDLNICWSNRAIAILDPAHALPDQQVRHYLYQSVGLEPWLGSETGHGPDRAMGDHYFELTDKGLTKELGYVGYYGEVLDWVTSLYDATRPTPDAPGDGRIKAQIIRIAKARAVFRYPALDGDGDRAMRIESIVGWRDSHYPGNVTYTERPTWDASSLYITAATLDPSLVGAVQQMFDDHQFYASVVEQMKTNSLRTTAGLLEEPDDLALLTRQPPRPTRLPMAPGQPDFAWADEQDGVLAVKHGDDILYASLYWRARTAINFLARVHDVGPHFERIAVVREQTQFDPSGKTFTRPDSIDPQAPHGVHYPTDLHSAEAGETLPIAKLPPDDTRKPGDEDPSAGRGSFYALRYGDYLIGMNTTAGDRYTLPVPGGRTAMPDLISNRPVDASSGKVTVPPQSTVVLYLGR
jgi:hypothetical protein